MELGNKIKQLRLKLSLTQEQLAEELCISPQSVSKWETGASMPDITLLPKIAEIFGVSIDDLFDLTVEQKFNRIENRMELEDELPHDVFWEYEEFLKAQLSSEEHKTRATALLAFLYDHNMRAYAKKASKYAKESIRLNPNKKECQWILDMADGHYVWDWNLSNHSRAIDFYRGIVEENPDAALPYYYLIDNLIADNRADEAEKYLARLEELKGEKKYLLQTYRAFIALARYDVKKADEIIENLAKECPHDAIVLFEVAQYYARKCEYQKAIDYYELAYANETRHPRYIDEPQAIAEIYEIMGDYKKAAQAYERVIDNQRNEWGMTEEVELKQSEQELARLRALAK